MSKIEIDDLTLGQMKQLQSLFGGAACVAQQPKRAPTAERPVMVTTEHRGVFFGYATDTSGDVIELSRARNCIYWSAAEKGFLGLAEKGPGSDCRIGPAVTKLELRKITSVAEVSAEAVARWEAAPFAK